MKKFCILSILGRCYKQMKPLNVFWVPNHGIIAHKLNYGLECIDNVTVYYVFSLFLSPMYGNLWTKRIQIKINE